MQPRAFFVHRAARDAHVEDAAFLVNAVIVNDVELRLGERRRDFGPRSHGPDGDLE